MTLSADVYVFWCKADLYSGTLAYQYESDDAIIYTEIYIPQVSETSFSIVAAGISATPIMMVWESSDLVSATPPATGLSSLQPPSSTLTSGPTTHVTGAAGTISDDDSHSSLSNGSVAAIATSATLSVILLVAAYLFFRAWRRRSSNIKAQTRPDDGKDSNFSNPCEGTKAEMEDPVSARELFKQSGAYRGKPELGSEVDTTHGRNPDDADIILPSGTPSHIAEDSLPGDRDVKGLGHAYPAELE